MKDILSLNDFSKEQILDLLALAKSFKQKPDSSNQPLKGKILASCFFEPSTRTQLSFAAAMKRLGGEVIGFSDGNITSAKKGESLTDMMKIIGMYADLVVIRHPLEGSAKVAALATDKPVINAGDGSNEHPTQTLLDLFTIHECQGKLDRLNIVFLGDLKYSRTVHSLALALAHFDVRLFFVSPPQLTMPQHLLDQLKKAQVLYSFHEHFEEIIDRADILYVTRIQEERFAEKKELESVRNYQVTEKSLENVKPNLKILHPLPRREEIAQEVDLTPYAHYFAQAENGVYVRMALLQKVLA